MTLKDCEMLVTGSIDFSVGSWQVPNEGRDVLVAFLRRALTPKDRIVIVVGHGAAGERRSERALARLAKRRAEAARAWLIERGLPAQKLRTRAFDPKKSRARRDDRKLRSATFELDPSFPRRTDHTHWVRDTRPWCESRVVRSPQEEAGVPNGQ